MKRKRRRDFRLVFASNILSLIYPWLEENDEYRPIWKKRGDLKTLNLNNYTYQSTPLKFSSQFFNIVHLLPSAERAKNKWFHGEPKIWYKINMLIENENQERSFKITRINSNAKTTKIINTFTHACMHTKSFYILIKVIYLFKIPYYLSKWMEFSAIVFLNH